MEAIKEFLFRLFNSLLKNGFYILWSLVIPLITIALGQGFEMLEHMIIQENWIQFAFAFTGLTILGFSLWIIPTVALPTYDKYFKVQNTSPAELFDYLTDERIEHRKTAYPLRVFAVAPLFVFIQAMALSYMFNGGKTVAMLLMGGVLLIFILYYIFRKRILAAQVVFINRFLPQLEGENQYKTSDLIPFLFKRPKLFHRWNIIFYAVWVGLFFAVAYLCSFLLSDNFLVSRIILLIFFSLYTLWQFGILYYIDNRHYLNDNSQLLKIRVQANERSKGNEAPTQNKALENVDRAVDFSIMNFTYKSILAVLIISIAIIVAFAYSDAIGSFSPLVILVVFFTSYLMLFDISYKTPMRLINLLQSREGSNEKDRLRLKGMRILFVILAAVFSYFLIFEDFNRHRIRKTKLTVAEHYYNHTDRKTLEDYFTSWWTERGKPKSVFLIAGQGGGSRAAAWIHLCLDSLDREGAFMNQAFAFSTASGSSVGVNMKLAEWRLSQFDTPEGKKARYKDKDPIKALYTSNLFSNSFYGLLFGDVLDGILPSSLPYDEDKNYRLQKEEYKGFMRSFGVKEKDSLLHQVVSHHFEDDYLAFYYPDTLNPILTNYKFPPLFFINTTHVQTGNRSVFSPVVLSDFSKSTDVYKEFKQYAGTPNERDEQFNLPLVTAVCQSQAFPIISAYNYLDSFGNLADGGIVENSGCGTLLDVYRGLKELPISDSVNIRVVIIPNSGGSAGYSSKNKSGAVLGAADAIINGCVYAYPAYWQKELISEVSKDSNDSYHVLQLNASITLARILNKNSMSFMHQDLKRNGEQIRIIDSIISNSK